MIVQGRNKLINALHDQLELARADGEGKEYLKSRRRHMKNPVTAAYAEAMVSRPRAPGGGGGRPMMVRFILILNMARKLLKLQKSSLPSK